MAINLLPWRENQKTKFLRNVIQSAMLNVIMISLLCVGIYCYFFSTEKDFDNTSFLERFSGVSEWHMTMDRKNTIYGELFGSKISFIAYPFFIPKQESIPHGSVHVLDKLDIAVMKIVAAPSLFCRCLMSGWTRSVIIRY